MQKPPSAAAEGSSAPADPLVSILRHVRLCIRDLEESCACCDCTEQQNKQKLPKRVAAGCCCSGEQQLRLRHRMRSTLSLLKLLLQVDLIGYKLQRQIAQQLHLGARADEIALEELCEDLRAAGLISEGQAFLLTFARYRCLRCLLAVRLWLQQEQQLRQLDAAPALGRGDFADSARHMQEQLYLSGGPEAKTAFYHMDWPYGLSSQQPEQQQGQLLLGVGPATEPTTTDAGAATVAGCPITEADRKAAGCLYTSIWRLLRAGRMRAAEALAAAKGASWLVEVLRGGEAWLEAHGSEGFSLPGSGGLCEREEIEFMSDASWLLRSAVWPCGLTLKDLLEDKNNSSSRKRTAERQYLPTAGGMNWDGSSSCSGKSTSKSDLLTGADASTLGRQGQGKTQRGLLQYACNFVLQASTSNSGRFGFSKSHYAMSLEEAGVYGYIAGDLSALFGPAETWEDAAFAVCHSLHEELAATLVGLLRVQQPGGLYDGEVEAVTGAAAIAAASAAQLKTSIASLEAKGGYLLEQHQKHDQVHASSALQLLLRRFFAAVATSRGGQTEDLLHAAGATVAALQDPATLDRAISTLFFLVLQNLPLVSGGLCSNSSSRQRIAAEQQDDFRLLQIQLIAAYMEMPFARQCNSEEVQFFAAAGAPAEQRSHTLGLLHQLQRLITKGATLCSASSGDDSPSLSCAGLNPEVHRFAALLVCALRDIGQQQVLRQDLEAVALNPDNLFNISAQSCDAILGQFVFDALDGCGALDFSLARIAQHLTPQRRAALVGEALWRRSASWDNAADGRLDELVAWACNSFPGDVLVIAAKLAESLWESAAEVLSTLNAATPSTDDERSRQQLEEGRVLHGVKFLLQLLLSIFGFFYLDSSMRHRAALPLLRIARTPQQSLAAAAGAAADPCSIDSHSNTDKEQQYALCLLGHYCLSICCYAAFIGFALEAAAVRRAAVRCAAVASLPAAVAVSAAAAAAAAAGPTFAKRSGRCSVAQWVEHALLPGLVIPLLIESLAFCKNSTSSAKFPSSTGGHDDAVALEKSSDTGSNSSDNNSNSSNDNSSSSTSNPFSCTPSLLLASPLATSFADALRCLREEQAQLQTESHRLPMLPLQQFTALEAFSLLLKAVTGEAARGSNSLLEPSYFAGASKLQQQHHQSRHVAEVMRTFLSESRSFHFPLLQDSRYQQQQQIAAAAGLEQQLQLQQLSQRLETLRSQQLADSTEPMSVQCDREQLQQELLRSLQEEEQQQELHQQELQHHFYMPFWCEGVGLSDNGTPNYEEGAALVAMLPGVRSRLLADFVLCAVVACAGDTDWPSCNSSSHSNTKNGRSNVSGSKSLLCSLLGAIGCNKMFNAVVSDNEVADLLLLATLQVTKV